MGELQISVRWAGGPHASQLGATALYEHAGFAVESEPFKDAGIDHVWMGLRLAAESEDR
jgi:predicted GNAT family N-acyltransferase